MVLARLCAAVAVSPHKSQAAADMAWHSTHPFLPALLDLQQDYCIALRLAAVHLELAASIKHSQPKL